MWWHSLEVNSDADERTVKKAYAKKIKEIDQETEIDEFTRIHADFRMAMKSFKNKSKKRTGLLEYQEEAGWYLEGLERIYRQASKRLDVSAWKNLFACMSFKEEKEFIDDYVEFFNDHYFLTDEIWALVERNYPLGNQQNFKWKDQCNGHLKVGEEEVKKLSYDKAVTFVEYKIRIYYAFIGKDYKTAIDLFEALDVGDMVDDMKCDLRRWYLIMAGETGDLQRLQAAYQLLKSNDLCQQWAEKYYLTYQKKLSRSLEGFSWLTLETLTKKQKSLLSRGEYDKALAGELNVKKRLFSWRGGNK